MKRNLIHYIGLCMVVLYIISVRFYDVNVISTIFITIFTMVGGIAIWIQLKGERDIKEAEFLMNYHASFVSNQAFTAIQKKLENHAKKECDDEVIRSIDRQDLINYLVYLKGLAALINKGVLHLRTIDDLYSYRFFLAVNNPVVQELELIPDAQYYKGCYTLHKNWKKYKKSKGLTVLQEDTCLEKVKGYDYYANETW